MANAACDGGVAVAVNDEVVKDDRFGFGNNEHDDRAKPTLDLATIDKVVRLVSGSLMSNPSLVRRRGEGGVRRGRWSMVDVDTMYI